MLSNRFIRNPTRIFRETRLKNRPWCQVHVLPNLFALVRRMFHDIDRSGGLRPAVLAQMPARQLLLATGRLVCNVRYAFSVFRTYESGCSHVGTGRQRSAGSRGKLALHSFGNRTAAWMMPKVPRRFPASARDQRRIQCTENRRRVWTMILTYRLWCRRSRALSKRLPPRSISAPVNFMSRKFGVR
jgi:hypothetical protein